MDTCSIQIKIPFRMSIEDLAKTFTAYLLGSRAFENGDGVLGPIFVDHADKWQLDPSNNFWLRTLGEGAELTCRADHHRATIAAMAELLKVRFGT